MTDAPSAQPRRRWWMAAIVVLLVAAGLAAWFLLGRAPAAEAVEVRAAPLVRTLQFSARVAALTRVEVGSTITARVAEVPVREGAEVNAGQLLVRLEDDEVRAALAQALAAERQAAARLAGLRGTGRASAQAQLGQAQAVLSAARNELARQEQLVEQGFVSASRLDEARRAVQVAQAQQEAAQAQVQAVGERGTEIDQAQAQLAAAQSATAAARARLAQVRIVAPAAARVLSRGVEPGQIVQPGRALLGLALRGPTLIVAQVDERFLGELEVGQQAAVVPDAFPERRLAATVRSVAPVVDAQRGAIEVKLGPTGEVPAWLREDMTLSVEVVTGRRERALVVPTAALHEAQGERAAVFAERSGRVARVPVRLGLRTPEAAEVTEGLQAGERVLLAPDLRDGQRVRVSVVDWRPARGADTGTGTGTGAPGQPAEPMSGISQGVGR